MLFTTIYNINYEDESYFNAGIFAAAAIACSLAIVVNVYIIRDFRSVLLVIIGGLLFSISGFLIGLSFKGNTSFLCTAVYECTYLVWTLMLCIWGYPNGFSPSILKVYNIFCSVGALVIISVINGKFYWIDIVCCVLQIIYDLFLLPQISLFSTAAFGWTIFSISGISFLGVFFIIVFATIIGILEEFSLLDCFGYKFIHIFNDKLNKKSADEYVSAGKLYDRSKEVRIVER